MLRDHPYPVPAMLALALFQGLALLILHQSIEFDFWPDQQPQWLFMFYSMAFVVPTLLLLCIRTEDVRRQLKYILSFGALVAALGYYTGYQAIPLEHTPYDQVLAAFIITMTLAAFIALIYVQLRIDHRALRFAILFQLGWHNVLTLGFALLFTLMSWAVLMLWAALFDALEIDFFIDLFTERWFYYPISTMLVAFGIILFRRLSTIIDTIVRLLHVIQLFLLVALAFVAVTFLIALPFTGLAPLWESGGSFLILWMQVLLLFFANGVYQYGEHVQQPYPRWVHRFVYGALATLPVLSAISLYGLTLRVQQYGWTVERLWAIFIWLVLAIFCVTYTFAIVRHKDDWFEEITKFNSRLGLLLLALLILVNSPLVDFRKISTQSQLARLEIGQVTLEKFDLYYFRYHLARPGYLALQELKTTYQEADPAFAARIDQLYLKRTDNVPLESFSSVLNHEGDLPEGLEEAIHEGLVLKSAQAMPRWQFFVQPLDANEDGTQDYLFVERSNRLFYYQLYYLDDGWQSTARRALSVDSDSDADELLVLIQAGEIEIVPPKWPTLQVGSSTLVLE